MTNQGLLKSNDGGLTWRTVFNKYSRDISFANNNIGFVVTPEGVYKTGDEGENWELNYTTEIFDPYTVSFDGESLGVFGGFQGVISEFPNGKAYIARTTTLGE